MGQLAKRSIRQKKDVMMVNKEDVLMDDGIRNILGPWIFFFFDPLRCRGEPNQHVPLLQLSPSFPYGKPDLFLLCHC